MRLNPECVRAILLICEQNLNNHNTVRFGLDFDTYNKFFNGDELQYTARKLIEGKLLKGRSISNIQTEISEITWEGHKLLDNVRDDSVWKTVISKVQKIESVSISILSHIAQQTVLDIINTSEKQS